MLGGLPKDLFPIIYITANKNCLLADVDGYIQFRRGLSDWEFAKAELFIQKIHSVTALEAVVYFLNSNSTALEAAVCFLNSNITS